MAGLWVYGPAVEAHAIFGRVTAMAKLLVAVDGETRTLDQARADIVADLLIDGTTAHIPAAAAGIRASVVVTVPALSLLDDAAAAAADPAVVEGVGPIPLDRARELCGGDAKWMRVLTHPETGMVLSVGRDQYAPPPGLRKLVKWRADRCMGPGCGMPAARCEVDHNIAWADGGETSLSNNTPFCKNHHIVKHHGGWIVTAARRQRRGHRMDLTDRATLPRASGTQGARLHRIARCCSVRHRWQRGRAVLENVRHASSPPCAGTLAARCASPRGGSRSAAHGDPARSQDRSRKTGSRQPLTQRRAPQLTASHRRTPARRQRAAPALRAQRSDRRGACRSSARSGTSTPPTDA